MAKKEPNHVEEVQEPVPVQEVAPPPPPQETHVAPHPVSGEMVVMAGPAPAMAPSPVAVGVRKVMSTMMSRRVTTRATHAYFRRQFQLLRSVGKFRY